MNKLLVPVSCLALATAGLNLAFAQPAPEPAASSAIDERILRVQVLLDRLGFSPGVIDGREGMSTTLALRGFQAAKGLPVTGRIDQATTDWLRRLDGLQAVRTLTVTAADFQGPYYGRLPKDPAEQAKLPGLGYFNIVERLAERFHTKPAVLVALNPGALLRPGVKLRFPNTLPASRSYDPKLPDHWRATLSDLNVDAHQPKGDRVVVDKSEGALKVYSGERLIAQFPATMGSQHDPLPLGRWKIQGAAYNPPFHYNPDLFWDADAGDEKVKLPPGPNGPVGVVWLDLSKPHYGIHGTPNPEKIGRTESHGCIRLTNWDAARLSLMVPLGTPAIFQA